MDYFKSIRPYYDCEVADVLHKVSSHSFMKAMLAYGFPQLSEDERLRLLFSCQSIYDFQDKIMYKVVKKATEKSITEFTYEGFEKLDPEKAYVFISNHRDIVLDTSLLNVTLHDYNLKMTTSAMGDNLIKKEHLKNLAKLNRNFIIFRNLPPREALEHSKLVSEYIRHCICDEKRSVWTAQREGRTKDGDDRTQQGVLKMLSLATPEGSTTLQYFRKLNIVPVSISYEFDPTDMLKIPALVAQHYGVQYVKSKKEDFENIMQGWFGQKGRVHISVGKPLDEELVRIEKEHTHINRQLQTLAEVLDKAIHTQYKLFPANYIAYDFLNSTDRYKECYGEKEIRQFERRIHNRSKSDNVVSQKKFLEMYANPVKNKHNY